MRTRFLVALCFAFLFAGMRFAVAGSYQDAAARCDDEVKAKVEKLSDEYATKLSELRETFRLRGDLEKTLAVKKEKERFAAEHRLESKHVVELPKELRGLQEKYLALPPKAAQEIAKSYLVGLEETKRQLTIDDKLDEAVVAQKEIDNIQKKYNVINPARGAEIDKSQLPKYVSMIETTSLPVIVDGQKTGVIGLRAGQSYRLIGVDGTQVSIRVGDSIVTVPVESTDLLRRIEVMQTRGVVEEEEEDVPAAIHAPAKGGLRNALRNSRWTWGDSIIMFDAEALRVRENRYGWECVVEYVGAREITLERVLKGVITGAAAST